VRTARRRRGADRRAHEPRAPLPQYDFPETWIEELVGELGRGGFLEDTFKMNEIQRARAHEARKRFSPGRSRTSSSSSSA
jgi:hypothetical protein